MPDDLYIKMNSRGKELTEFEHFKSHFSELLPKEYADIFNHEFNSKVIVPYFLWDLWQEEFDVKDIDIAKRVDSAILRFLSIRYRCPDIEE